MKTTLLAAALVLAAASPALAAEPFDGHYVGASVGYDRPSFEIDGGFWSQQSGGEGAVGSAFAGYQRTFGSFVLGGEAAGRYGSGDSDGAFADVSSDWAWDVSLRPGYKVSPNTALFGALGVSWADVDVRGVPGVDVDGYRFGYVVGLGVETYVTGSFSLRADYRHAWYDSYDVGTVEVTPSNDSVNFGAVFHW